MTTPGPRGHPVAPTGADALRAELVAHAGDAFVIADRDGTIVSWNDGATAMFGYESSEAVGANLDLIVPEQLRERHWEGFAATMTTGETKYADRLLAVPAVRKDGARISIEFRVTLLGGGDGPPEAIGAVIRDVTEHWLEDRRVRERLAELESARPGDPS